MRSWLFVPADSEKKLGKIGRVAADAVICDLEDAVAPERKEAGRRLVREFLDSAEDRARLWVRINPLDSGLALADLAAVAGGRPAGIVLPKIRGPWDLVVAGHYLEALEVREGLEPQSLALLAIATETPDSLFAMGEFAHAPPRLAGVTWGAEDLAAELGSAQNRTPAGDWTFTYELARSLSIAAAAAAGVPAIDTVYTELDDADGLAASCERARLDGFSGKLAIHPSQIEIINAAFTPSAEEIERAERIVAAFAERPDAGALRVDGRMADLPHLKQARRLLERAGRGG
jgi:citrate lyase subunit beta/citryl-CoA lyase